ncbi:MAG: class I tRNA ligase family protein, partial [Cyanobacteria bacterium P01_D01_bin.44]
TWFSSGLWPFSTMGWPDETTADFKKYYPTTTLVTGFDIIFFWVARMTMMAGHFTDTMPFETVYIHGLVRDEKSQKMSKSKGNGIDPLILIEKYGTDALRYTLIREVAGAGQDIRLDYNRKTDESSSVEASRNFTNKLWNASRFVMMNLGGQSPVDLGAPIVEARNITEVQNFAPLQLADRWILSRYHQTLRQTREYLDKYGLGEAAKVLYEFVWGDFCDWYIELVKPRLYGEDDASKKTAQQTLAHVLDGTLKLLHPFMPHITEEVWHTLTQSDGYLPLQAYPEVEANLIDADLEKDFELLIGVIRTVRNLRAEAGIKPSAKIEAILKTDNAKESQVLTTAQAYIKDAAKVETLTIQGTSLASAVSAKVPAETYTGSEAAASIESEETAASGLPELDWSDGVVALQTFIKQPMAYLGQAFRVAKTPATITLLLVGAGLTLTLSAKLLEAINVVPLLGDVFRLIGLSYVAWTGGRYLYKAENRSQLWANVESLWEQVSGLWSGGEAAIESTETPELPPTMTEAEVKELATKVITDPAVTGDATDQRQMFAGVYGTVQVLIPLTGLVDVDALKTKLEKDLGKAEGEIKSLTGRLGNKGFVDKAPTEVIQGARDSLAEAEKQAELIRERLAML